MIENDVLPLFQFPYNRNRMLLAFVDVSLLLLNSFALHRFIASRIIEVPTVRNLVSQLEHFDNQTRAFSRAFVEQVEEQNRIVTREAEEILEQRWMESQTILSDNHIVVQQQIRQEEMHRDRATALVRYLRAWSRVGNTLPYRTNVTREEIILFETTALFLVQTGLQELSRQTSTLTTSIQANVNYHLSYLNNLTGRPLEALQQIQTNFQLDPIQIRTSIDVPLIDFETDLVASLQQLRLGFQLQYQLLFDHLITTQLALKDLANAYEALYNLVLGLQRALQQLRRATLGLSGIIVPSVDLTPFPPVELFLPESTISLPTVDVVLAPLDELILSLDAKFDALGSEIVQQIQNLLDRNLQVIFPVLSNLFTLDDYNPPPIIWNGRVLSLPDALQLQADLSFNVTRQIQFPSIAVPPVEDPFSFIPNSVPFANASLSFTPPSVDLLSWAIPDLGEFALFVDNILEWLAMHWSILEPVAINGYRALKRLFEYFEGTAVPLPVIDLRTSAEKVDKKRRVQRSKIYTILSAISSPWVTFILSRVVPVLIFVILILLGANYYLTEFVPNCLNSNTGTPLGNDLVSPLIYNRAAGEGEARAIRHSANNHAWIQMECQQQYAEAYDEYTRQLGTFETRGAQAQRFANQSQRIEAHVDLVDLCRQHEVVCGDNKNDESSLFLTCPLGENRTTTNNEELANPCELLDSIPLTLDVKLQDPRKLCDENLPTGKVDYESMRENAQRELPAEENWCLIEWYIIGRVWRFAFIIGTYILLFVTFGLLIGGYQVFHWRKFRPEEYHIHTTANRAGEFTQPEYSDLEAKTESIEDWEKSNRSLGILQLGGGTTLLLGWITLTILIATHDMTPVWIDSIQ